MCLALWDIWYTSNIVDRYINDAFYCFRMVLANFSLAKANMPLIAEEADSADRGEMAMLSAD